MLHNFLLVLFVGCEGLPVDYGFEINCSPDEHLLPLIAQYFETRRPICYFVVLENRFTGLNFSKEMAKDAMPSITVHGLICGGPGFLHLA